MFLFVGMKSTFKIFIIHLMLCYDIVANSENFQIKTENLNKRLVSYTFLEKIVITHHDCVRECFHYGGQCKAINYNLKDRTCELKSKGSADSVDVSEYEHAAGYVFTDITDWPKLTLSECSSHNCHENQNCFPHGNVAYRCMDKVDCGQVPRIEFGTVTAWVTTDGAVATYSCDFGYEFNGTISEVTCKGDSWKAEGPIACILKDCGPLTDISYGTKTVTATTHGGIALYTCNYGYQYYSGDLTRTCVDGTWNGYEPSCTIKDCGPLSDISYGTKTMTATTHGGIAIYTCNYGYQYYSGDLTRTCVDGTWDGYEPSCKIKDCGHPAGISHGLVYAPVTTHGASATYTCDAEYQITAGDAVRICTDGLWVGTLPVCSPIPHFVCYNAGQSHLFQGTRQTTIKGLTCQRWDSQYPHTHGMTSPDMYPSGDVSSNENYCRDPDYYGEPWCYTTDPNVRWESCGIPVC